MSAAGDIDICEQLRRARGGGCIAAIESDGVATPELAAARFGLISDADVYEPIDRVEAVRVLEMGLHQDLLYGRELMPSATAKQLAGAFLDAFDGELRLFTNGTFGRAGGEDGRGWTPATEATVDTGVLVLGASSCGCLWFADDD